MDTVDRRHGSRIVYPEFQRGFVANFCLATFGGMLATSLLLLIWFYLAANRDDDFMLWPLIAVNCVVLAALVALTAVVALNLSHKVGGPLYRLEKRAGEIAQGDLGGEIHLRQNDELQNLAQAINQMSQSLTQRLSDMGSEVENLSKLAGDPRRGAELQKGLLELAAKMRQGLDPQ